MSNFIEEQLFSDEDLKTYDLGILKEPIIVPADKFYLDEVLTEKHFKKLFDRKSSGKIFVLNKNRCGNGGTTGFIRYAQKHNKGLIVSVPNRSIVFSKERENKELSGIVGGVKNPDLNRNVRVATWDKTESVESKDQYGWGNIEIDMDDLESWNPSFWSGSLLLVDEYHKLVEDNSYREICPKLTKTIIDTDGCVVLMSATPNDEYIEFLKQYKEVIILDVQYDNDKAHHDHHIIGWYNRPKGIENYNLINHLWENVRNNGRSKQMVVFYSNITAITTFVEDLPEELQDKVEVLCSSTHKNDAPNYSEQFNPEKSLHLLTSANFTGMDIKKHIDAVLILGGDSGENMSYSWREVKQMLGRFRVLYDSEGHWIDGGYDSVYVVKDGRKMDDKGYEHAVRETGVFEFRTRSVASKDKTDVNFINDYMTYLYLSCEVKKREGWLNSANFIEMMSIYNEYSINTHTLPEIREYKKHRDIPFAEYKEKRLKGIKVKHRMGTMSDYYIEKKGEEAFANASRNDVERFYRTEMKIGDIDLETLSKEDMYDLLLGDKYYRGSYLMGVLKYLGKAPKTADGKVDYRMLEITMNKVFGCLCVYSSGNTSHPSGCWFLCIMVGYAAHRNEEHTQNGRFSGKSYIIRPAPISTQIHTLHDPYEDIRVSRNRRPIGQTTSTITENIERMKLPSVIEGGERAIYERRVKSGTPEFEFTSYQREVMTELLNDPSKITGFRADPERNEAFEYYKGHHQSLVSEFYDDTGKKGHSFKTEEMKKIDCLIVDIDHGIRYNEFAELYKNYEWTAIPTISNTDPENWHKFRVIFPLAHTLELPNDSLKVLKTLRSMVCPFEDRNHNLGSYMNREQWAMRIKNVGELFDIPQEVVVYLDTRVKTLKYHNGKFKMGKSDGSYEISEWWSIEEAIEYYHKHDKDDERHHAGFIIKNNLSDEDCVEFEKWLEENSTPSFIRKHWKNNKKISKKAA